ncbi:3-carboxy-cis,cis-muconate cycloisomerase [Oligella ureolytica]|uniref:3-carboxy-cis,cis-muconate cycloisomerase n=1 Tax=Oligella ureolytica TaxID=90244 RepID=A0A378XD75_9BURK|nr:adenylosuccinate lyase [Oligella ureolytica]QPT40780.1 adenylosuccinate lyase [Oligella ureolytica]SUA52718.1 3-carboxy-cis,cis-muconate cycloisomerase [Oligella ureolytica]SUA58097.1 3-carboxy-cis,cis-muconate cycloisomerase [Oligella ureolytica]
MSSSVMDSEVYRGIFVSERMRKVFSDESLMQKWLDAWVALARAEADLGVIPQEAAKKIADKASFEVFDPTLIREGIVDTTHPLIVQIRQFTDAVGGREGGFIHWGATTQDIMDTAVVLQMKEAQEVLLDQLNKFLKTLLSLSDKYKSTIMPGRTHGQHALPITLGYKIAIWADEIGKHIERLEAGQDRYLVSSFSGAAGTLASISEHGLAIQEKYSEYLGLKQATITWHVQRDGFAEYSSYIAMIAGTIGKIANEIINLQRTEIGEIEEGFKDGQIGSSTMPHKRNPMICEYVVGLTRVVQRNASLSFDAMLQEHERDMTFWTTEWSYIPQINMMTSGGIEQMQGILERFIVHEDKMARNLDQLKGLIVSENLMLTLGVHVGRQVAHDMVYKVSMQAFEEDRHLLEVTLEDAEIMAHLSDVEVKNCLDPKSYVGLCEVFVERVQQKWKQ